MWTELVLGKMFSFCRYLPKVGMTARTEENQVHRISHFVRNFPQHSIFSSVSETLCLPLKAKAPSKWLDLNSSSPKLGAKMKSQSKQINFEGHPIHVGIDVHKASWQVTIQPIGVVHKTIHMSPGSPFVLQEYLMRHYPGGQYQCAYESGFCGFWIQEELSRLGMVTKVFHAGDIPTTDKEKRQKTDSRDSLKIAKALYQGDCESIYIPQREQQQMRSFVRHRERLVVDRQRIMLRIKSHLYFYGIEAHAEEIIWKRDWSGKHIKWLEEVAQHRNDWTLISMLSELSFLRKMEKGVLLQLRVMFKREKYQGALNLLRSVPGIGFISSVVILTEIGLDFGRFNTFDRLGAYCGLMPDTKSSGQSEHVGDITQRGNTRLRSTLIEGAWAAIYRDMELRLCYESYKKRMPPQKAIIKIARKLLNRIRRVMLHQENYRQMIAV
ncbi:MAG: IS110 family transposase [Saprospiraceae bacterium]|nr:IS110 family transposase [Saprospiraceae bacterium]